MLFFKKSRTDGFYKRRRSTSKRSQSGIITAWQKGLLRLVVIMAVCLAVYQLKAATNPLDFYLQVAGDVEAPAMNFSTDLSQYPTDQEGQEQPAAQIQAFNSIDMVFQVNPYAPVKVRQDEKLLGVIDFETIIPVYPGTLILDATGISYPVTVQIGVLNKTYTIELENEIKKISIQSD